MKILAWLVLATAFALIMFLPVNALDTSLSPQVVAEAVSVSAVGNTILGAVQIKNNGTDMQEEWLIEMRIKKSVIFLTFFGVSEEKLCDMNYPNNIYRKFKLSSGQSAILTFQATVLDGKYDVDFISAKKCVSELTPDEVQNYDTMVRTPPFDTPERRTVLVGAASKESEIYIDPSSLIISVFGASMSVLGTWYIRKHE